MARVVVCFLAVLLLLVIAVSAIKTIYSEKQLQMIDDRSFKCVEHVPSLGDYDKPGPRCWAESFFALRMKGVKKEAVTGIIVKCLKTRPLSKSVVDKVERCLVNAMAKHV